jgi:hypothetical protein
MPAPSASRRVIIVVLSALFRHVTDASGVAQDNLSTTIGIAYAGDRPIPLNPMSDVTYGDITSTEDCKSMADESRNGRNARPIALDAAELDAASGGTAP